MRSKLCLAIVAALALQLDLECRGCFAFADSSEKAGVERGLPSLSSKVSLLAELSRIGLRSYEERRYSDVLKAWYLVGHLKDQQSVSFDSAAFAASNSSSVHESFENAAQSLDILEANFRSLLWATAGQVGLCPSWLASDDSSAGLWPLAMHNYYLRFHKKKRKESPPFFSGLESFERGRQYVALRSESRPSRASLRNLKIVATGCKFHPGNSVHIEILQQAQGNDRLLLLSHALEDQLVLAKQTLNKARVDGADVVVARLVDLWIWQKRQLKASQQERTQAESPESSVAQIDKKIAAALDEFAALPVASWLALERLRSLRIFDLVQNKMPPEKQDQVLLSLLDEALEELDVTTVNRVLARFDGERSGLQEKMHDRDYRNKFIALEDEAGFKERAYFYFKMALEAHSQGKIDEALKAFAFALKHAPESAQSEPATRLALQWVSYILAQYQVTDEMLGVLRQVLPREHFEAVWKELLWAAILDFDAKGFALLVEMRSGRSAAQSDFRKLASYARGEFSKFSTELAERLNKQPANALKQLQSLAQNIEKLDFEQRIKHRQFLGVAKELVRETIKGSRKSVAQKAEETILLIESIEASFPRNDRPQGALPLKWNLDPEAVISAGAVRLPPETDLPWPFQRDDLGEPAVFQALELRPREAEASADSKDFLNKPYKGVKPYSWTIGDGI